MHKWPVPTTVKHLRGFLGLIIYYRRFIANNASISAPLTGLLRHDSFEWSTVAPTTFIEMKSAMMATPVLALPDFSKEFVNETDASNLRIGAVLM